MYYYSIYTKFLWSMLTINNPTLISMFLPCYNSASLELNNKVKPYIGLTQENLMEFLV